MPKKYSKENLFLILESEHFKAYIFCNSYSMQGRSADNPITVLTDNWHHTMNPKSSLHFHMFMAGKANQEEPLHINTKLQLISFSAKTLYLVCLLAGVLFSVCAELEKCLEGSAH